ncbi:unnamed protein product [Strongylus vulgaris]|uniref:Uncharacterized protein n=1 Tax=Strongylus vulgaris TaxID=40348 RepID=A0A3P7IFT0_STRVU|nr:unnamed protein product [Strongylus vulgaris]
MFPRHINAAALNTLMYKIHVLGKEYLLGAYETASRARKSSKASEEEVIPFSRQKGQFQSEYRWEKNGFEEKLRIYASNMRKLIITARNEINTLKQENIALKQKLESSGLIECPACLFHFQPRKEHQVFPKYIKVIFPFRNPSEVFRGRLSLEIEFNTLDQMNHWLNANHLDMNSDGLPTVVPTTDKKQEDLTASGSLLPRLVQEEVRAKRERIVISTRLLGGDQNHDISRKQTQHSANCGHYEFPSTSSQHHGSSLEIDKKQLSLRRHSPIRSSAGKGSTEHKTIDRSYRVEVNDQIDKKSSDEKPTDKRSREEKPNSHRENTSKDKQDEKMQKNSKGHDIDEKNHFEFKGVTSHRHFRSPERTLSQPHSASSEKSNAIFKETLEKENRLESVSHLQDITVGRILESKSTKKPEKLLSDPPLAQKSERTGLDDRSEKKKSEADHKRPRSEKDDHFAHGHSVGSDKVSEKEESRRHADHRHSVALRKFAPFFLLWRLTFCLRSSTSYFA